MAAPAPANDVVEDELDSDGDALDEEERFCHRVIDEEDQADDGPLDSDDEFVHFPFPTVHVVLYLLCGRQPRTKTPISTASRFIHVTTVYVRHCTGTRDMTRGSLFSASSRHLAHREDSSLLRTCST
jgi:hypothetical protein